MKKNIGVASNQLAGYTPCFGLKIAKKVTYTNHIFSLNRFLRESFYTQLFGVP